MNSVIRDVFFGLLLLSIFSSHCKATNYRGRSGRRGRSGNRGQIVIQSSCIGAIPALPHDGTGCGVPEFLDQTKFGDNSNSRGAVRIIPTSDGGMDLTFVLEGLSRPDLVLTAWIVWAIPGNPENPSIFNIANAASPCAAFTSSFSSGLGKEPNQFRYVSGTRAQLRVRLNFNPTFPNEGPLTSGVGCLQKDIPGIQGTEFRQFENPRTGKYVPSGSGFLRQYDPETGFEKLDSQGRPLLVRSPVPGLAFAIAGHIDRTTHGVSQGTLGVDHFEIMSFFLPRSSVGIPSRG